MTNVEEQLRSYYEHAEYPTDSEEYQQSLDIFLTLRSLLKQQRINEDDVRIIESIISGYSFRRTSQVLHMDRRRVTSRYHEVLKLLEESL